MLHQSLHFNSVVNSAVTPRKIERCFQDGLDGISPYFHHISRFPTLLSILMYIFYFGGC